MAQAWVIAARGYGELEVLRTRAREAILARAALRARWMVAHALTSARPGLELIDVARLCGLSANVRACDIAAQAYVTSWDWDLHGRVFKALAG